MHVLQDESCDMCMNTLAPLFLRFSTCFGADPLAMLRSWLLNFAILANCFGADPLAMLRSWLPFSCVFFFLFWSRSPRYAAILAAHFLHFLPPVLEQIPSLCCDLGCPFLAFFPPVLEQIPSLCCDLGWSFLPFWPPVLEQIPSLCCDLGCSFLHFPTCFGADPLAMLRPWLPFFLQFSILFWNRSP